MDQLLKPDLGLIVWTVVTFLSLVFILKAFAWGPLLAAIEGREKRMKDDLEAAKAARAGAEKAKAEIDAEMEKLAAKSRELLAQAAKEAEALRSELKHSAESEAQKIKDKTLAELAEEKRKLVDGLRKEVASLSVLAAEKLMRKSVDDSVQKSVLDSFFKDLESQKAKNN
jgi:F-type H+-transporting ATPase subunit b